MKQPLDSYVCRHGLSYTVITGSRGGLEVEQLFFVPLGFTGEVMRLRLTNHSAAVKRIKSSPSWSLPVGCLR